MSLLERAARVCDEFEPVELAMLMRACGHVGAMHGDLLQALAGPYGPNPTPALLQPDFLHNLAGHDTVAILYGLVRTGGCPPVVLRTGCLAWPWR